MERIQYRPVDNFPNGKNHIFFAAHPDDVGQYFEPLRQEICRFEADCAFLVDANPTQPWGEGLTELLDQLRIQIFLFPVTRKLLCTENTAVSALLPYALERHIPIAPIMLEVGLEEPYQRAFGDLQYLDKVLRDPTAIPYEEKLRGFLRDVLISQETAEKIRAAFDAYIFLSYRKKDRALAAKLMRLIHEIPQMRDVAIWYDEFLVPGENFNANITEVLNKSDLFAMAVTPNLVCEENYVRKTEYPKADDAGKPILPIQVETTDPVTFASCFEKLAGRSIDAYNGKVLEAALLEAFGKLRHITLAQNNDPMHTYLMGLAYLNGIDVERDYERAVRLMTAAAESDCLEAVDHLAHMYMYGQGTQRDGALSLRWQKKAVNGWRKRRKTSDSVEDRMGYAESLRQLATHLLAQGQNTAAIGHYENAVEQYHACIHDGEYGQEALECLIATENILTTAYLRNAKHDRAEKAARRIIDLLSAVPLEEMTVAQRKSLALAYSNAAMAEENRGNTPAAAELHRQALEVCENEVGRQYLGYELAHLYLAIGDQYLKYENYLYQIPEDEAYLYEREDAQEYFLKARKLMKECLQESPCGANMFTQAETIFRLGSLFSQGRPFDECETELKTALMMFHYLEESMPWPIVKNRILACYDGLSRLYLAWGKSADAEACVREARARLAADNKAGRKANAAKKKGKSRKKG